LLASCTALIVLIAGLILLVIGLFQLFGDMSSIPGEYSLYSFGLILLTIGATLTPFAVLKIKSLSVIAGEPLVNSPTHGFSSPLIVPVLLVLWVIALPTGYLVADKGMLSTLIMPFLAILGVIIPIAIYLFISHDKIESLARTRNWGAISSGMSLSPILATILEIGILTITLVFIIIIIMQDSSLMSDLQITATRLSSGQDNPEVINNMLAAFIQRPVNKFLIFSIVSGLIPIIEEVVKQIPFWLLSWRKLTPRVGFMIGALGGAGFALTESLLATSSLGGSDQWLFLILGRAGASLMHVITGALGGWGLASAIHGRNYMKAALVYIACIIIHGTWNALAIWEGIARLVGPSAYATLNFTKASLMPMILMGVLFLLMLMFLINNKKILKD
jgi:hypothetical protein